MKKLISKLRNLNITLKLIVSMSLLIILSVSIVTVLSYDGYTEDLKKQFSQKNSQIITLVSMNIDTYLDDLFRLSLSPYYNDEVMDALDKKVYGDDMKYLERLRIVEGFLDEMMIIPRSDILRVTIFTDELYRSERIPMSLNNTFNYKASDWYKKVMKVKSPIFLPAQLDPMVKHPKNKVFSVANILRSTRNTNRIIGVIKVDATYSGIESICSRINMGTNGGIFIIDQNGQIIYSSINNIPYKKFYTILKSSKSYIIQKNKDTAYLTNSVTIPRANWTIVSVSSLNEVYKVAAHTRNNSLIMSIICSITAFIILVILAKLLLQPFLRTVKMIKKVETGDINIHFPQTQNDEVGYLNTALNGMLLNIRQMMDKNTELIKEIYESKYLQKEAHLKSLYNQIRPHFIYNTLNMISLLIQSGKSNKAVDNTNRLSHILRGMANWDKDVTLENELKLLDSYLGIQISRYEGKLEYFVKVDESLYSYMIPALILQPIVENCIVHGCEHQREKTIINIWSERNDNSITLLVSDNCGGINEDNLFKLQEKLESTQNSSIDYSSQSSTITGIGLYNVNRRLKIKYGQDYGINISSTVNKGTLVKIILPLEDISCISL